MIVSVVFDIGGVLADDVWEYLLLDESNGIASKYSLDSNEVRRVGKLLWEAFAYCPETQRNNWQALEIQYRQRFIEFFWGKQPPSNIS